MPSLLFLPFQFHALYVFLSFFSPFIVLFKKIIPIFQYYTYSDTLSHTFSFTNDEFLPISFNQNIYNPPCAVTTSLSTETTKCFHLIRVDCHVKSQSCYVIIKSGQKPNRIITVFLLFNKRLTPIKSCTGITKSESSGLSFISN